MPKWKTSFLGGIMAAIALAQETAPGGHDGGSKPGENQPGGMSASGIMPPSVRRVGQRLACLCGSCKNTVADCPMLECGYCSPLRQQIADMLSTGKTDDQIVDAVVAQKGKEALAIPPTQGFSLVAWTMPYVAVAIGLFAIWTFLRRMSVRRAEGPAVDPAVLDRYHDRIEKDLEKLD